MPEVGFFELYPSARPLLPAGSYIMGADHELQATPPNNANGDLAIDGTDFTVKILSPRYVMPPGQILSTFPPNAAVGDWRQRLPQIVFKRRTLPWERDPDTASPKFAFTPETRPPYLALIVLAEGEGVVSGEVAVADCVTPGTPMLDDVDTSKGKYLEVRQSIIDKVFPTVEDLGLLAHVRKVNLEDTELALGDDDGYLAVVVANRLPQPGPAGAPGEPRPPKRYTAYLINVEGQLHALPTGVETEPEFELHMPDLVLSQYAEAIAPHVSLDVLTMHPESALPQALRPKAAGPIRADMPIERASSKGIESAATAYATGPTKFVAESADDNAAVHHWIDGGVMTDYVVGGVIVYLEPAFRFPVLTSWDFVCTGDGTFESIMMKLDSGMLGTEDELLDPALRPEIADTGHISLEHRTRRGEPAQAWYRGAFVPQPTVRVLPQTDGTLPLPHTGDQLRRVVPDGHEDLSLASAFEIGRLLALSKPSVVAALARWRRELFGVARLQQYSATYVDDLIAGFAHAAAQSTRALDDLIATHIVTSYADGIRNSLPTSTEFSVARIPADIEGLRPTALLGGLGLEAKLVREAVGADGAAAFASFPVVTGEMTTKPLSTIPDELSVLQAALMEHIETVAEQAVSQVVDKNRRRRRDHLDRLIDRAVASNEEVR